jgi:hypothetical protein
MAMAVQAAAAAVVVVGREAKSVNAFLSRTESYWRMEEGEGKRRREESTCKQRE